MLPGIDIEMGGITYVVPPLALGDMEVYQKKIAGVIGGIDANSVAVVLDVSIAALRRNYPDMTREDLGRIVDVSNFMDLFNSVMDIAGLRRKAADAEKAKASNP